MTTTTTSTLSSDFRVYTYDTITGPVGLKKKFQIIPPVHIYDSMYDDYYSKYDVVNAIQEVSFDQSKNVKINAVNYNLVCNVYLCFDCANGSEVADQVTFVASLNKPHTINVPEIEGYTRLVETYTHTPAVMVTYTYDDDGNLIERSQTIENMNDWVEQAYRKKVTTTVNLLCGTTIVSTLHVDGEHGIEQTITVPDVEGYTTNQTTITFASVYDCTEDEEGNIPDPVLNVEDVYTKV